MDAILSRRLVVLVVGLSLLLTSQPAMGDDLSAKAVLDKISRAKKFLTSQQKPDGSWSTKSSQYHVGITSLVLLALVNSGMTPKDGAVQKGLQYLRSVKEPEPHNTYEVSLMIMALAAAKDGARDDTRILILAQKLENGQITRGKNAGIWDYNTGGRGLGTGGDHSNGQFAVLGLRDAALAGVAVDRSTWERTQRHWLLAQNGDGGWDYSGSGQSSTGSMTVAGIATMLITSSMLRDDSDLGADGAPNCCGQQKEDDEAQKAIKRGLKWLENHFAVGHNPGGGSWLLYYLYGMERAGRLSARRFFGKHDWYREGAKYLIDRQSARTGAWTGVGGIESDPVIGTGFALLFLSKGLAPVLINKLQYGTGDQWNLHRYDIQSLTDLITGKPEWPKLLTWQIIDINNVVSNGSVSDLLQSPILYLTGDTLLDGGEGGKLRLKDEEILLLREYVNYGGFIFAVTGCQQTGFEKGMHQLVSKMYPQGEATLKPLSPDHPIYGSEHNLSKLAEAGTFELLGVDVGCRTAIVYSPDAISCLWDRWARQPPRDRSTELTGMITRATNIGVNVVAYATGREPPAKLHDGMVTTEEGQQDNVKRAFLQIAKIRHSGGWDAAPQALRNLLLALNRTVGMSACTERVDLPASGKDIFDYPILYMQGRSRFQMGRSEQDNLRKYLTRGGVLFADACCGAPQFDRSFRAFMQRIFPEKTLQRIPPDHEMFTSAVGHDIRRVRRRLLQKDERSQTLSPVVREGEPFLEGIGIDGRYVVIYSKYDISCALEHQASVACDGYAEEDAVRIGTNIVLYAMLQDVHNLAAED